jgi:Tfp pilus assembly protein PilF
VKTRISRIGLVGLACSALVGCSSREETITSQRQSNWREAPPDAIATAEPEPDQPISAKTYFAAGQLFEKQGALQRAILQYRKVLELEPQHVGALNQLGMCFARLGRYEEAERYLHQAIQNEPNSAPLYNNLGFAYIAQRRWVEAENQLRSALEIKPDFARARVNLGMVLAYRDRHDEALEQFLMVLPEHEAYYNLGLLYRAQKQYPEAAMAFERALDLSPRFVAARHQLDTLKFRVRRTDQWSPNTGFDPLAQAGNPPATSRPSPTPGALPMTPVATNTNTHANTNTNVARNTTTSNTPPVKSTAVAVQTTPAPTSSKPVALLTVEEQQSPSNTNSTIPPMTPVNKSECSSRTQYSQIGELPLATPTPFYDMPVTTECDPAEKASHASEPAEPTSPARPQNVTGDDKLVLPMTPVTIKEAEPAPAPAAPAQPATMPPAEPKPVAIRPEPTGPQLIEQQIKDSSDDDQQSKGTKAQDDSGKPDSAIRPMYPVEKAQAEQQSAETGRPVTENVQMGEMRPI